MQLSVAGHCTAVTQLQLRCSITASDAANAAITVAIADAAVATIAATAPATAAAEIAQMTVVGQRQGRCSCIELGSMQLGCWVEMSLN